MSDITPIKLVRKVRPRRCSRSRRRSRSPERAHSPLAPNEQTQAGGSGGTRPTQQKYFTEEEYRAAKAQGQEAAFAFRDVEGGGHVWVINELDSARTAVARPKEDDEEEKKRTGKCSAFISSLLRLKLCYIQELEDANDVSQEDDVESYYVWELDSPPSWPELPPRPNGDLPAV